MMQKFLIEHVAGNRWLAPHGFVQVKANALQFNTLDDAQVWLKNAGLTNSRHNIVPERVEPETFLQGQVVTEYDPISLA